MPDFTLLNIWWKDKDNINRDKSILEYKEKNYKWKPRILKELDLKLNNVYTLRGPRQIGKTTLVKLVIKGLLKTKNAKSCFYWSCDEITDFTELKEIVREYLEITHDLKERYIFLDEISSVKDWQKAIKTLVDSNELKDCSIFLTGSHSLDIKYGIERLPGRIGKHGRDYLLLPMAFREFCELVNPKIKLKKVSSFKIKEFKKQYNHIVLYDKEIRILFNQYMLTGGFPLAINEFLTKKEIPDYVFELYFRWIVGDVTKWGRQEKILKQILRTIIKKQATPISWDTLAKEAEIKSHKTVASYIELLEHMFVLLTVYFINPNKKIANFDKNKKIYFFDPLIFHILNKLFYFKEQEITPALIESMVLMHLARVNLPQYKGLFSFSDYIFYWKNKVEVDGIIKVDNDLFPVEVKYQNLISKSDWKGLYHFNKGILVTKNYEEFREKYAAIPVHLFLTMV